MVRWPDANQDTINLVEDNPPVLLLLVVVTQQLMAKRLFRMHQMDNGR